MKNTKYETNATSVQLTKEMNLLAEKLCKSSVKVEKLEQKNAELSSLCHKNETLLKNKDKEISRLLLKINLNESSEEINKSIPLKPKMSDDSYNQRESETKSTPPYKYFC